MQVSIDELRASLLPYLARLGLDERDSTVLSWLIIEQEMIGNRFGAVKNLLKHEARLRANVRAQAEIVVDKPAMRLFKWNGREATLITADHLDAAVERARSHGIYAFGFYDSTYNDFFEVFCRRIAAQDCIGLIFENGGPQGVVPHGGTRDVTGTNPLAYSIPTHGDPIVFDAATSVHAYGLIGQARERGWSLPDGYVDRDGRATIDPNLAHAILPFGGYKWYAINLLVDVLSGALVRGRCGLDQPVDSERFIGTLVIIIDPAAFGELADFKDSTTKLVEDLLAVPAADPDAPVRVPGLRGAESARRAARSGFVELEDSVWQRLVAASAG